MVTQCGTFVMLQTWIFTSTRIRARFSTRVMCFTITLMKRHNKRFNEKERKILRILSLLLSLSGSTTEPLLAIRGFTYRPTVKVPVGLHKCTVRQKFSCSQTIYRPRRTLRPTALRDNGSLNSWACPSECSKVKSELSPFCMTKLNYSSARLKKASYSLHMNNVWS